MCYPTSCSNFYPVQFGLTVYGLSWCPYNKKANKFLKSKGISYYYYDIEKEPFNLKEN
jgi:glutaredoxin